MSVDKQIIGEHGTLAQLILVGGVLELQDYMSGLCTDTKEHIHRIGASFYRDVFVTESMTAGSIPFIATGDVRATQDNATFFWNNTSKRLGIGTNAPDCTGHFMTASAGAVTAATNTVLAVENSGDAYINILSGTAGGANGLSGILAGDSADNDIGKFYYSNQGDYWQCYAGAGLCFSAYDGILLFAPSDVILFGTNGAAPKLRMLEDGTNPIIDMMNATTGYTAGTDGSRLTTSGLSVLWKNFEQAGQFQFWGGAAAVTEMLRIGYDQVFVPITTQSTDKDTGALVVDGGLGVEKNGYFGGNLYAESNKRVACGGGTTGASGATVGSVTLEINGVLHTLAKL